MSLHKKFPILSDFKITNLYDSQKIEQNKAVVNFFPKNGHPEDFLANYDQNPFPGAANRIIAGMNLELVASAFASSGDTTITEIVASNINAIKSGAVRLSADQNQNLITRVPIEDVLNTTTQSTSLAAEGPDLYSMLVGFGVTGFRALPDPYVLSQNQTLQAKIEFENSALFPASWAALTGKADLYMRMKLTVIEVDDDKLDLIRKILRQTSSAHVYRQMWEAGKIKANEKIAGLHAKAGLSN